MRAGTYFQRRITIGWFPGAELDHPRVGSGKSPDFEAQLRREAGEVGKGWGR